MYLISNSILAIFFSHLFIPYEKDYVEQNFAVRGGPCRPTNQKHYLTNQNHLNYPFGIKIEYVPSDICK